MSFTEFGHDRRGATVPEHNRLRGLEDGNPHPQYAEADHGHDATNSAIDELPQGVIGYVQVVSNQGGITAEADLTDLTVDVTVGAGRRIRITGHCQVTETTGGTPNFIGYIKEGSTYLGRWARDSFTALVGGLCEASVVIEPSEGDHTYHLALARDSGTGTLSTDVGVSTPAFILVEDIGPA